MQAAKLFSILAITLGTLGFLNTADAAPKTAEASELKLGYHTKHRDSAWPNGHELVSNPPSILWPVENKKENPRFRVTITPTKGTLGSEIKSTWLDWAAWKPEGALAPGTYQWTLETEVKGKLSTSGPFSFTVAKDLLVYAPPRLTAAQVSKKLGAHPRFFQINGSTDEISRNIPAKLKATILKNAELFLQPEPKKDPFADVDYSLTPTQVKRQQIARTKVLLNHLRLKVIYLGQAYSLTGDQKYVDAALEKYAVFNGFDKKLFKLNDFTAGMALDTALYLFDGFYDQLNEAQRKELIDFALPIAEHEYEHHRNRFETLHFDNHTWQKGVALMARSALILGNHVPEANTWMEYIADAWNARGPATGFNLDGGWHNGNSYMTANVVTLIQAPLILEKLTGFNYLSHPWYQNLAQAMITTYPGNSYSNGFGDGHDSKTMPIWVRAQLAEFVARRLNVPELSWYSQELGKHPRGVASTDYDPLAKHPLDSEAHQWLLNTMAHPLPKPRVPSFPRAAVFKDTGVASIHNDLANVEQDMHVALRASTAGSGSHTCNSQNAFNVIVGGTPLFLSSGYYINFSDAHNLLHYRHTRGHNSVLVDGLGQDIGRHAIGTMEEFLLSDDLAFVKSDASQAYQGKLVDPMWVKKMKQSKIEFSKENGYGESGLQTFKRRLLVLDKRSIVIYDELEAEKPAAFNWLLHTPGAFKNYGNTGGNVITAKTSNASADVELFSSSPIQIDITDQFHSPALNWPGKKIDGKLVEYPNQYHLTATSEKAKKTYFLAVISVHGAGHNAAEVVHKTQGSFSIGDWTIEANLDASKPAKLTASNSKTKESLVSEAKSTLTTNGKSQAAQTFEFFKGNE